MHASNFPLSSCYFHIYVHYAYHIDMLKFNAPIDPYIVLIVRRKLSWHFIVVLTSITRRVMYFIGQWLLFASA